MTKRCCSDAPRKRGRKPDLEKTAVMSELYERGFSLSQIAFRFSVSKSAVWNRINPVIELRPPGTESDDRRVQTWAESCAAASREYAAAIERYRDRYERRAA